jgi:anti-sigma factor RsiW
MREGTAMVEPNCPPESELQAFLLGGAPEDRSRALVGHLESCPACAERFRRLAQDNAVLRSVYCAGLSDTLTGRPPSAAPLPQQVEGVPG